MAIARWIHPEGWRFVLIFGAVAYVLSFISETWGWIGLILTCWCGYFFRNPERVTPPESNFVISPADGKVVAVRDTIPPSALDLGNTPRTRISIFLNVFDVHVNRVPISGVVKKVIYHPGKFFNASLDKASEHNERNTVVVETETGEKIAFVQIAGLIARRIRCDIEEGQHITRGTVYGLIRFGSRMDVYLPVGVNARVLEGQRMIAGETILADLTDCNDAFAAC